MTPRNGPPPPADVLAQVAKELLLTLIFQPDAPDVAVPRRLIADWLRQIQSVIATLQQDGP